MALPAAESSAMAIRGPEFRLSSTEIIQRRAIHLNGAMDMAVGGDWKAVFSSMTMTLSAGIAANHLEKLYSSILDLTYPGDYHGPLHRFFGVVFGDLELIFETVDPSHAVPLDLVYAFAWQARERAAAGLAGLYAGQLLNSAGQAVSFALKLRTRHHAGPNVIG